MIIPFYNPHDWYWFIGDNVSRVWSSKRRIYVSIEDQEFINWLINNQTKPSTQPNEEELFDYLWPYGIEGPKTAKNFRAKKLTEAEASAKIADLEARLKSLEATR